MAEMNDEELLDALGVEVQEEAKSSRTALEERIIAGFEDIERFFEQHGRAPEHGEDKDIFERLYAVRLDRIRASEQCRTVLMGLDKHGLLEGHPVVKDSVSDELDDETILTELGVLPPGENDVTNLTHVKTRAEIRAAEEIARRIPCLDFNKFKPLFLKIQEELKTGDRQSRRFKEDASIQEGEFFILGGQIVYVAKVGEEIKAPNGSTDARLRVIYGNGTESDLLLRSLQRALHKDETGRRITDPSVGPLFGSTQEDDDLESGTIYVLRSKSDHPFIAEHRKLIHKIGVTGGDVNIRLAQAAADATYLLADVEVVATYKLYNINRTKLEKIFHRVFSKAQIDIAINDRFGKPVKPKEWFLVPLSVIDEVVKRIQDETITGYHYNPVTASLDPTSEAPKVKTKKP